MRIALSGLESLLFLVLQTNLALAVLSSNPGDFNVVLCGDKKGKTVSHTSITFIPIGTHHSFLLCISLFL